MEPGETVNLTEEQWNNFVEYDKKHREIVERGNAIQKELGILRDAFWGGLRKELDISVYISNHGGDTSFRAYEFNKLSYDWLRADLKIPPNKYNKLYINEKDKSVSLLP